MSESVELQTCHDLACLQCIASHWVEVKSDVAISVYSCHDERSVVSTNHPQKDYLNIFNIYMCAPMEKSTTIHKIV